MEPHEQRVVTEKAELDEKIVKLEAFLDSQTAQNMGWKDLGLLGNQLNAMKYYSGILGERIKRFAA